MGAHPDWLQLLVQELPWHYGLPDPAGSPSLWPETGGRGVLLAAPNEGHVSNAQTVRFMSPGLSPALPDGYMLYTDAAGGYISPGTGTSRFGELDAGDESSAEVQTRPSQSISDPPDWSWPADMVHEPQFSLAREHFLGRTVQWLFTDHLGWRLVLAGEDWLKATVYIDLYDLSVTTSGQVAVDLVARDITGQEIAGLAIDTGVLKVTLANGIAISSAPDENYESWQLVAANQGLWVCLPGGDLAEFPFRHPNPTS